MQYAPDPSHKILIEPIRLMNPMISKDSMIAPIYKMTSRVLSEVEAYLVECGIHIPKYKLERLHSMGGSHVTESYSGLSLHLGNYPTRYVAEWWIMHEMGHLLWAAHDPCRDKTFRQHFGEERPEDEMYQTLHAKYAYRGPIAVLTGQRLRGEPSSYGAYAGGEERFCELLGLMYASGGFQKDAPRDLTELWHACWHHGLVKMTSPS